VKKPAPLTRNKDATIIRHWRAAEGRPHGIDQACARDYRQTIEQVPLDAGDIIMTGTSPGAALSPDDRIECGVGGVGVLKVTIGKGE